MSTSSKRKKSTAKGMRELTIGSTVIGYVRVSTEEQKKHGDGLDVQIKAVEAYCVSQGYELIDIIVEDESGALIEKRDKWQSILEQMVTTDDDGSYIPLDDCPFEGVIVNKLDRMARNLKELMIMHDDMFIPAGVAMVSVKDKFDTSSAQGRLFFQILGGFAEFERSLITERTMDGITNKARKGMHASGSIPTGYKKTLVDGKKQIMVDEEEAKVIQLIFRLKDEEKLSYDKIADYLNKTPFVPKRSKTGKWIKSSVYYIYNNPKYKGIYTFNRQGEELIQVENEALRILQ